MMHQQVVCRLCEKRRLTLVHRDDPTPGEETTSTCPDCGFRATQRVTVVYDPEWYELQDPYGPGDVDPAPSPAYEVPG